MGQCPCGSDLAYSQCCGPFLDGGSFPSTPLALMRSRFTAYATGDFAYIAATMRGAAAKHFDLDAAKPQAAQTRWEKLEIIDAPAPPPGAEEGFVEFKAYFTVHDNHGVLHERSRFVRRKGRWFYIDGRMLSP